MTITAFSSELIEPRGIRLLYESDLETPLFHILKNGKLYARTYSPGITVPIGQGEDAIWEVFDTLDYDYLIKSAAQDRRMEMEWRHVADVHHYRIEKYIDSEWVEYDTVVNNQSAFQRYRSRQLENNTLHQFRAVTVTPLGNEGTPREFSAFISGVPELPDIGSTYDDETGIITIDEN